MNKTASQLHHERMQIAMAKDLLGRCSELEKAERIARHYLSHAATAQYLLKVIELSRSFDEPTDDAKAAIKHLADQIRTNHAYDLGIELSWPKAD